MRTVVWCSTCDTTFETEVPAAVVARLPRCEHCGQHSLEVVGTLDGSDPP